MAPVLHKVIPVRNNRYRVSPARYGSSKPQYRLARSIPPKSDSVQSSAFSLPRIKSPFSPSGCLKALFQPISCFFSPFYSAKTLVNQANNLNNSLANNGEQRRGMCLVNLGPANAEYYDSEITIYIKGNTSFG